MAKYDSYKREVLECTQWLCANGFFGCQKGSGGNISVRIEGSDLMAVTPSSRPYMETRVEDICIVDFDLNVIEGDLPPSIESAMHVAVYKNRADVNAVVHTHQTFASIFAVLNIEVPPLFDEVTFHLGEKIRIVPYGMSGSPELVANVTAALSDGNNAYILQNHGALCVGKNLQKAWVNAELLEKVAKIYYHAMAVGRDVSMLPEATLDLFRQLRG